MRYWQPYIPLHIAGDDAGNARRQSEADRINATTERMVDGREVVKQFTKLLNREGLPK